MRTHTEIGITSYLSSFSGIGGRLRKKIEDFFVEEIPIEIPKNENGRNLCVKIKLRNWETNHFVKIFSRALGISRKRIRFTGMKDKRSISVQYFCIVNYSSNFLPRMKDVEILEKFQTDYTLNLGDLFGNRFCIKVSDAECNDRVGKIVDELNGYFPNFFGVQRFGASRPVGHIVGKFIIKGDFKNAVRYYIGYPDAYRDDEGRKVFFENLDARESLKQIDIKAEYERAMLNYLVNHPDDYIGALRSLPNNLLLMFVHAYQAYLFNRMVSERVKIGIDPQIGDVVMKTKSGKPVQEYVKVTDFNIQKIKEKVAIGEAYVSTVLVGYKTRLSEGLQGEIERKILKEENIRMRDFRIQQIPELSTKGRRRNILAKFMDFNYNEDCIFQFWLYSGSYATSLMREFMKVEALESY